MGHVQSKKKKNDKKKHRKIMCTNFSNMVKSVTVGDTANIHKVAGDRIYRDSVNLDQVSNSSGYFSSSDPSPLSSGNDPMWAYKNEGKGKRVLRTYDVEEDRNVSTMSAWEELCTYKGFPLDDHPALSKLQNEQNSRLENMEHRMSKIRTNAQQSYDRKKFAHLFRAKKEEPKTDRLLREAKDMLQSNMEVEKADEASEYSGEIIPVKIVEDTGEDKEDDSYLPLATFGSFQISKFLKWSLNCKW